MDIVIVNANRIVGILSNRFPMYNNTLITHSYHVDNRDKAINATMPKNPPTPHYKIHNR